MGPDADNRRPGTPGTVLGFWRHRLSETGSATAFLNKDAAGWRQTTWSEADQAAREIAGGLVGLGVGPGDRIALICETRLEWALCDVAIAMAGAVSVPIYPSNTAADCAFIIADSGAKVIIVEGSRQMEKVAPLAHGRGTAMRLVHIEPGAAARASDANDDHRLGDRVMSLDALRAAGRVWLTTAAPAALQSRMDALGSDADFTIIYTSGTTGVPKGVVLSHGNFTSAVDSAIRAFTIRDDDEQYLFLPLAHVLARELFWVGVRVGGRTWFSEGLSRIKDNLLEARPTFMAGVPRIFEKMNAGVLAAVNKATPLRRRLFAWGLGVGRNAQSATRAGRGVGPWLRLRWALAEALVFRKMRARLGLDRCRFLISGAAPLAPEIAESFHACGLLILEGYGLTETVGAAFVNQPDRFRFGTVGPAIDVVEVKIAEDGEILMRGPSVFRGYHNDPVATAEAIDAAGWFHSGDIGRLEDGFLRVTDRKKDIIVTAGGKNIAPQPIENAIKMQSPLLSQIVIAGDRRPYCVALCTLSEQAVERFGGGAIDAAQAAEAAARSPALLAAVRRDIDAVNARLAAFETIKRFAILPEEFTEAKGEVTPSLKVKRKVVVARYQAVIDGLY